MRAYDFPSYTHACTLLSQATMSRFEKAQAHMLKRVPRRVPMCQLVNASNRHARI
jgi:hypothetical protein